MNYAKLEMLYNVLLFVKGALQTTMMDSAIKLKLVLPIVDVMEEGKDILF